MLNKIISLLYPRRCPVCDDIVLPRGRLVCDSCKTILKPLCEPLCFKCGRQIISENTEYCDTCLGYSFNFDRAFSLWPYNNTVKSSLSNFKYKGRREFAEYYADQLYEHFGSLLLQLNIDAVIPVPIHSKRLKNRGYNQAELISLLLSEKLHSPHITGYLVRTKNTLAQKSLNPVSRRKNLKEAFSIDKKSNFYTIHIKNILLIDDIYTTGSTADTCSKILKEAGAEKVYVLSVASVRAV